MNRFRGRDEQVRITPDTARRVLRHVSGMRVPAALHALRFTVSMSCPEVARVIQLAAADAARRGAHAAENLVVVDGVVRDGADVVRLRRQAHGLAGWITTRTTDVMVEVAAVSDHSVASADSTEEAQWTTNSPAPSPNSTATATGRSRARSSTRP